ncbi:hypothetical protein [Pedobacter mucosus]|uniref:hypothetical protein n=1 Tax=Pedobacter mucosus TaxID=2895286 RepID=UPI001EE435B0|nr:hypothetical protein [Pedobacter mucosus]UKT64508.1 hypothetical protein LOK61_01720 [Pedobacter mucosus]
MKINEEVVMWKFGGRSGNLKSNEHYQNNQGYSLYCKENRQFLIWERGQLSINFNFSNTSQQKFHLSLPDNQEREILTGEPFALGNGGGDPYLRYGKQNFGINLKWVAEPLYEWKIFDASGVAGKPISLSSYYAIYNTKVKPSADFLIFLEKYYPRVVDLGWPSSPSALDTAIKVGKTGVKIGSAIAQG